MKKFRFDKSYLKIAVYCFITVAALILFEKIAANPKTITSGISVAFNTVLRIMTPFLYGFLFAFFLNPAVRFTENKLLARIKFFKTRKRSRRGLSVAVIYVIVLGAIVWLFVYLVPEVIDSVRGLVDSITASLRRLNTFPSDSSVQDILDLINESFSTSFSIQTIVDAVFDPILKVLAAFPTIFGAIFSRTWSLASTLLNIFLGLVIGIYMLCEKENAASRMSQTLFTLFKPGLAARIVDFAARSNTIVEKFVVGKALDSLIIGVMFFIIASIMKLPYPLLLSLIIGVTNMIPFFGPFIGAAPTILIVLINRLDHPITALWAAVAILALQQFDGSILGPKILGDSTGIKPMGVIFAITVGGALFGLPGMFFGVPFFAVLSEVFIVFIDRRYKTKYRPVGIDAAASEQAEEKEKGKESENDEKK